MNIIENTCSKVINSMPKSALGAQCTVSSKLGGNMGKIVSKKLGKNIILKRLFGGMFYALITSVIGINAIHAQEQQVNADEQSNEIKLNLQEVDIRVLINTVAEVSGKNFIVDPRVKGKVSVISGQSVNPEELYDYFLAILEVHNYATVTTGNIIKILPSNVIKQKPTTTLFQPTEQENDEQITQIIRLQHAPVQDLVAIIRPLIPPTSHFAPHIPSNSVVLTDTAANIQRVLKIIRRIDVPDKRSNTHVVYLEKTSASDMASSLTQLIASSADPKEAAAGGPQLSIQPFEAINALVISATEEQFARVKALIDELDVERDLAGDVNVISLKHANAQDLVSILNDVTSTNNAQGAAADFNVQADEASNSLIVKASGGQLKTVRSVIEKLDQPRAQVFVETIIAEVQLDQNGTLGVTLGGGVPAPDPANFGDGVLDPTVPTTRLNTVGSRSGTGITSTLFPALDTSAGLTYNLFDFGRFQLDVVLNALRTDTNTNVLSTPTILTLDNEEAEIIVGQEVPFVTGVFNNGLTNVGGGAAPGDGAGGQAPGTALGSGFQTIERRDVGIMLRITPQINEGDTIRLEVFQETSDVVPASTSTGAADIVTNRRSINAVVQVDDGQVVALGGLITDDFSNTEQKVPFLGSLPIVGRFFRNTSKTAVKQNLMVFLKPRIIRSPKDLEKYSRRKYEEIRRDEVAYANRADDIVVLPDAEPAVLAEYDKVIGNGEIITESRERKKRKGPPKKNLNRRIKDIIYGRKSVRDDDDDKDTPSDDAAVDTSKALKEAEEQAKVQELLDQIEKNKQPQEPVIDISSQRPAQRP